MSLTSSTRITRADAASLARLNDLLKQKQSHRVVAADTQLEHIQFPLLDEVYLLENLCFVLLNSKDQIQAFFSITEKEGIRFLDFLAVDSDSPFGDTELEVWSFLAELANRKGWPLLRVVPLSGKEQFFARIGFYDTALQTRGQAPIYERRFFHFGASSNPYAVQGASHVMLSVNDLDTAIRFYMETLGLRPLAIREGRSAYFLAGDMWVAIVEHGGAPEAFLELMRMRNEKVPYQIAFMAPPERFMQLSQRLRDVQAVLWQENSGPGRTLYFKDPAGNRLAIHEGTWRERIEWLKKNPSPNVKLYI